MRINSSILIKKIETPTKRYQRALDRLRNLLNNGAAIREQSQANSGKTRGDRDKFSKQTA